MQSFVYKFLTNFSSILPKLNKEYKKWLPSIYLKHLSLDAHTKFHGEFIVLVEVAIVS